MPCDRERVILIHIPVEIGEGDAGFVNDRLEGHALRLPTAHLTRNEMSAARQK
jgi:hypothetical protein